MQSNQVLITQAGLDHLKAELTDLQNVKRPLLVERLSVARSMGDLAENSDYQSAKEELAFMDSRIDELDELIKNAKVAIPTSSTSVNFGHTVTVKVNSSQTAFQIVGEPEADPSKRKISHSSPLGLALMGKKVGDQIEVDAPVGKISYTIISIS
ncbi:transcription elongation factor GreA [Candidatus Amesbacteria bacterium RIFOXYB1_FULL_44_23]|uniref:Transcription elongation factor GreA n=1 Tax=Candidatus Amesbacteria bacterium RIFOXYB1_FULL_44_23 TaxID=1797263 RepID=A0A1F4ZR57_9BACT|nr:MAG: transcription elongation factor GreA [Candidatus Amesbacteria bacterium RIFOXYB1_FULL_44_23]